MKERFDTYCGLYCGGCEVLIANQKGFVEEKAKEWNMDPNDLICNGCKSDTVATFCQTCGMKVCAEEKGIEFCFQCSDYPCKMVSDFKNDDRPHHSIIFHNLGLIKELGIKQWMQDQEKRWSCPTCGEKFSWYSDKCSNCDSVVKNCLDDEKELVD